jgi:hypothetical protein
LPSKQTDRAPSGHVRGVAPKIVQSGWQYVRTVAPDPASASEPGFGAQINRASHCEVLVQSSPCRKRSAQYPSPLESDVQNWLLVDRHCASSTHRVRHAPAMQMRPEREQSSDPVTS